MLIVEKRSLESIEFWGGAEEFVSHLTDEELYTVERIIEDLYPEGISLNSLNDIFRFEPEAVCEWLELKYDEVMERDER